MKKLLWFLLCAVLCLAPPSCGGSKPAGSSAPAATAADATAAPTATPEPAFEPLNWDTVTETAAENFIYSPLSWDDECMTITGYTGADAIVKVPAAIEGKPVTNVAEDAFRSNETITHVYLPDTITYVGKSCFNNCAALVQLRLPADLHDIPNSLCRTCPKLVQVDFPTQLNNVQQSAFLECVSLKKVELPATTTYIEQDAFDGCSGLTTFKAPGLNRLGQCSLRGCENLTELELYAGIQQFSGNALNGCTSLSSITLVPVAEDHDGSRLVYENGIIYEVDDSEVPEYTAIRMLPGYPADAVQLHPNTVELEHSVFYGCQLRSIEIPAAIEVLPGNAFYYCDKLETVTFAPGSQLQRLEMNCFANCTALKEMDLSFVTGKLTCYGSAFFINKSLTSLRLPDSIDSSDDASSLFGYAKDIVINYRGKDYTHDQLSELQFIVDEDPEEDW